MLDFTHLEKAKKYSRISGAIYFLHFWWAIHLSACLLFWSLLMIVHAIVPQLVGFYVIEKLISYIKHLKDLHPDDPLLKKITFDESDT